MTAVVPENTASWKVLEHIGLVYEKKARSYDLDMVYYAITLDQYIPDNSFHRVVVPESS